jgi:hypothetical protein
MSDEVFDRLRQVEDQSLTNTLKLAGHEKECAIRYGHITESVTGIRSDMRQAVVGGITLMLAVLGFLVKLVFFP